MATAKPNTSETGQPGGIIASDKGFVTESLEQNDALKFPASIPIFDRMRSTDGHVSSTLRAMSMPIQSANWDLNTEGVRPEVETLVRTELGLSKDGQKRQRRRRQGIVLAEHIRDILGSVLWAGFAPFEQVYEVAPPLAEQADLGLSTIVHLRKLAPRLPQTVTSIGVGADGGLDHIIQTGVDASTDVKIPVANLVFYVLEKEGADWSGRSMLRQSYKNWKIKDTMITLDAQIAERNGMGVPVVTYTEGLQDVAAKTSQDLRAGATSGVAVPVGVTVEIKGVTGSTVDLLPKIKYHDQEISRQALAMFLDLGQDNGARSLGDTFVTLFIRSLQAVADLIAETITEHVIRDLVEFNFGPDEPYPVLTPGDLASNEPVTPETLKLLVDAGLVKPDEALEARMRDRYGLPDAQVQAAANGMSPAELNDRVTAATALFRAGYEPAAALVAAGLDPIAHSGLLPIALKEPGAPATPATAPAQASADAQFTRLMERYMSLRSTNDA
ncbi:phage portal protein family protein [Pseudarthrobacter sp. P1]|uniref:phage portal protein family protein n=1 Tax=Pseudarthrobacter sp. P1 TaxID=3418418 RepID=UPI003CE9EA4E